ncbi:unnamed protein product [Adineta ricciae]|uniref:G/T mismatch-specific thymine DNA glycosylase n=1 Tax=Adineta ricciae TaxID=249248 RepID=A0A815AK32_ADIRI|nr:unnamed protein product [Adineta ricciae]CAF1298881.1 unnamed protein product [Adineta ricciae]
MSTEYLVNEQQDCSTTNEITSANGHYSSLTSTSNSQQTTSLLSQANETHTQELLDEALDSVKNVLMQTFKKNLESGGDLTALKNTLGSDEVAEVFLAKLKQSLKRDHENESKTQDTHMEVDNGVSQSSTLSSPSNATVSPITNTTASPSSPQTTPTNNKRKSSATLTNPNRFDGATEEELSQRILQDILQPNLDIVFIGVNPSLYAVHKGHHYGGPGNHFWKLLHMSGLIPDVLNANDDYRMLQYGIGFTNIVQRPSKAGSDITKNEITAGAEVLMQKIKTYRPKIVAFNGRGIYEVYAGNKHFHYGKQPELFLGTDTHVFVMPSSSARCSQLPRAEDKLPFYVGLRKLRDFVNGSLHSLNEAEITFPDIKIKDIDDVSQKTVIRISNTPFSELSEERLKPYGGKIPSGQMISKHPHPPVSASPPSLIFNTEALTTQTMSILHNTNRQTNENILTYDQPIQRVSFQTNENLIQSNSQTSTLTNGSISTKNSFCENPFSSTNAAVLDALANGCYNSSLSSSQSQQTYYLPAPQTVRVNGQQVSHTTFSSLNNNSAVINSRLPTSATPYSSYVIHHQPQPSTVNHSNPSSLPSASPVISRPLLVVKSSEPLPSFDTIRHPSPLTIRAQSIPSSKDSSSSQQSIAKPTLIVVPSAAKPVPLPLTNSSTIVLPKLSKPAEKPSINSIDDLPFVRYERDSDSANADQFRFSYIIDEHSPALHKRLRYVSINDL